MEKLWSILTIIVPIAAAILVGVMARRRQILTREGADGLQQFAVRIALPCVLFNSCLTSSFQVETLTSMVLVWPLLLAGALWAFRARRGTRFPYHNLPLFFAAQESGMLGIPLFLMLFGQENVYRMATLDVAQILVAVPTISILSMRAEEQVSLKGIIRKIITAPYLIAALLGIALNLTGAKAWLDAVGVGPVLTETISFLGTPISAVILICIGYNFSLGGAARRQLVAISAIHFGLFACFAAAMQAVLFLLPGVSAETRWALFLYCMLPPSFLAPGLGRREEEYTVASGVCSLYTLVTLAIFCVMAVVVA